MAMDLHTALPSLEGITEWVHGEPDLEAIKGQPLLVYFWAISCHFCHQSVPKLQAWRETYGPQGLQLISIHSPRSQRDTDIEQVRAAIDAMGIVEPCGIDNLHKVKKAFSSDVWPAFYLFDREGNLIQQASGMSGLGKLKPVVEEMVC